jgi:uncharacterized protein (TIGR03000 family)
MAPGVASVRVILPDPKATVLMDGNKTTSTGPERLYHTPELAPGTYSYEISATWMQDGKEVTQVRTVPVTPGRTSVVNFTQPQSEALPPPKAK